MQLTDVHVPVNSKKDRVEFFVFGDTHIGAINCAEGPIRAQVREITKHANKPNTHVVVFFGGDICDYIKPGDFKRYGITCLADWFLQGKAEDIRERLSDVCNQQRKRATKIFQPLVDHGIQIVGGLGGNHEHSILQYSNVDIHGAFCGSMGMPDLSDEVLMRVKFSYKPTAAKAKTRSINIYAQHGHGGGRTPGAEPNHLTRILNEWEDADIVFRGHSHTFCELPPKAVPFIPKSGKLPKELRVRYRFAANWGCWKYSHSRGPSTYESRATYPARAMVTIKAVVWPFWHFKRKGVILEQPKIELRKYNII